MTNLQKLQDWVDARVASHYLEAVFFTAGPDANDIEEMAGVALDLIHGFDTGEDATEAP